MTKRVDIEEELAKIASAKNFNMEKLKNLLGKSVQIQQKRPITPKKKPASKSKRLKIEDQTSRWLSLTSEQLKNELNDLKRYPDSTTLRQASYSILKPNEKRFRNREKIINIIIERISDDRAIAHLGR